MLHIKTLLYIKTLETEIKFNTLLNTLPILIVQTNVIVILNMYALKVYNVHRDSVYFVHCTMYTVLSYQLKLKAARLKKGTAQWYRLANSVRIFINLNWYDYTLYTLYIIAQFIYLVRVRINKCGPSTLYSVTYCTMYIVHRTLYTVQCTLYIVRVHCTEEVLLKRDHIWSHIMFGNFCPKNANFSMLQVLFRDATFCKLTPGISVPALYGN